MRVHLNLTLLNITLYLSVKPFLSSVYKIHTNWLALQRIHFGQEIHANILSYIQY